MAKQVRQVRFYGSNEPNKNYPNGISHATLASGSAFQHYVPAIQLGIQALPGTKFYLNNSNNPIIIGYTGIYELDLNGLSEITSLKIDAQSLNMISRNANAYLIVDIIYEDGEG